MKLFVTAFAVLALGTAPLLAQDPDTATAVAVDAKGLKDAYKGLFMIGAAGDLPNRFSEAELANVKQHYDVVTPENCMKPQPTHPQPEQYNFATPDALVEWAAANDIKVWGHTLCWHSQTGQWFFQPGPDGEEATREVVMERLKDHIMTVAGRYKGKVIGWDVVNESINDGGDGSTENLRNNSWYRAIGPDVLNLAFKWAKEADPDAELYYNDYNIDQGGVAKNRKHGSSLKLLKRLIDEGAPIDGVGIQGHWHLDSNLEDIEAAIVNYADLGLRVAITELDVTASGGNSGAFGARRGGAISEENYQKQAEVYRKLFEIFKKHSDKIDRVTFWGVSDTRSWRRGQDPLLFTGQMEPKPAFTAVMEVAEGED